MGGRRSATSTTASSTGEASRRPTEVRDAGATLWLDAPVSGFTIREGTEEIERDVLSPRAVLAAHTKGRERDEQPDPLRTAFQVDRDRIVHSKAFRRLKHKTQVFLAPEGDHYR